MSEEPFEELEDRPLEDPLGKAIVYTGTFALCGSSEGAPFHTSRRTDPIGPIVRPVQPPPRIGRSCRGAVVCFQCLAFCEFRTFRTGYPVEFVVQ